MTGCPDCRQIVFWDESISPDAWRHTATSSRWCSDMDHPRDSVESPHLPVGWDDPWRAVRTS